MNSIYNFFFFYNCPCVPFHCINWHFIALHWDSLVIPGKFHVDAYFSKFSTFPAFVEKAREFQKNIYFCFMDYTKAFDCVDHNKLENS